MADVNVEKRRLVWPWILLGLIIVTAIVYFLFFSGRKDNIAPIDTTYLTEAGTPPEVGAYIAFVRSDTVSMSINHEYSSNAIKKLIRAIQVKAEQLRYDIQADLGRAGELANEIIKDPYATTHANSIKTAANITSNALQNMQQAHYPNLTIEMHEVSNAVTAIDPDQPALKQQNNIQSFFIKAASLLDKMK